MPEDLMRYDVLAQDALRGVVRAALAQVARSGLPGEHHFFIAFDPRQPGVRISERLRQKYPEEITIVIQHQYWDLEVGEDEFAVGLSFDNIPEKLVVPFRSVKGFFDPAVQFGLQFETQPAAPDAEAGEDILPVEPQAKASPDAIEPRPEAKEQPAEAPEDGGANVVPLDSFRKK